MAGSVATDFVAARLLLTAGRICEQDGSSFSPYKAAQAVDPVAREVGRAIIGKAKGNKRPSFICMDDRPEGNAVTTIEAMPEFPETV